jgi:tRNA(Ile)-lysidine synthase
VGREDVRAEAEAMGMNIEEAGRKLRYDFLGKTASEIGRAKVATGHTLTDQAETLLMRLMRGSGLRGLAGIFPVKDDVIVRPLLRVEREDIEAYLEKKKIEFRVDESNFDRRFLRNRVRLDLLPYLKENFEPAVVQHLGRIAAIIREEDRLLDEIARKKARKAIVGKSADISMDLQYLSSLPRALARRVIREFITRLRGSLKKISFEDVESVLALAEGKEYSLKERLVLRREGDRVFLKKTVRPEDYEYLWSGQEPLEIKSLRLRFTGKKFRKKKASSLSFDDRTQACLDLKKLKFPLLVRSRREGDRYRPLGAPGRKKIKEIMRARGIPLSEREKRPVFLSGEEIVWILGLPVSDGFKIEKGTIDIFQIKKL